MSLPELQVASHGTVHLEEGGSSVRPFRMLALNACFGVQ